MSDDKKAPATKKDISMLMESIGKFYDDMKRLVGELDERVGGIEKNMKSDKEEIMRHFDVVAEDIKHDFQGAFHDKLEQHDDRIVRLEKHTDLVSA